MQCLTQQRIYPPSAHASDQHGDALSVTPIGLLMACLGLVLTLLLAAPFAEAKIYKTVDADGNISYSDVPPADAAQRDESTIELQINNTYNAKDSSPQAGQGNNVDTSQPGDIVSADGSLNDTMPAAAYQTIAISAPAADAALRSNSGDVTLSINLQPSLRAGDQVRFFMDGKPVGTVTGTSLSLTNIDRGTHTLAAVVLDGAGKPRISSATTSFSLQRFAPKPPPPPRTNRSGS